MTTDPLALRHWMVAGPEVARIVVEFEEHAMKAQDDGKQLHHEQHFSVQDAFQKDVKSLIAVFEEFGNPFLEKGQDLLVRDTRDTVLSKCNVQLASASSSTRSSTLARVLVPVDIATR